MWRNFGWTAILATWTIFLILNSGLTGERVPNNPQNNNEDSPYKTHRKTYFIFDKKADFKLQYTTENFKSNDRSSMHVKAVSLEFKNTENRDSQLSGYEKHIAMSNAKYLTTKYLKDSNDKSARLITKRVATKNIWLPKVIVVEKSKDTKNYLKFMSSLRPLPSTSRELKNAWKQRKRKERTVYVFLSDDKKIGTRHDTQAFDKEDGQWKKQKRDRIFSAEKGMTAFFSDKFTKSSRSEKDSSIRKFKNSDTSQLETTEDIESRHANETHVRNRNGRDSRQGLKLTKSSTNELIHVEISDKSPKVEPTFSNYSSSKENQSRKNETITTATITENSFYERSMPVTWITLIFNSKISRANKEVDDEENIVSPHSSENKYSKSYKVDKFLEAETYKRDESSKIGFEVNIDTHGENKKKNENIVDLFTFRASNSLDNHFTKKKVSFTTHPLYKKKNLLKASDIFNSRYQYNFPISDIDSRKTVNLDKMHIKKKMEEKITVAANYATHNTHKIERVLSPNNLSTKENDKSNLNYQMPARISVTQKRNPMHVQHVECDADCERPRTTEFEAEVRDAFRIGLWNVSGPSRIAKFDSFLDQKIHSRPKYSRKFHAINIGTQIAETTDGKSEFDEESRRTSTESVSIFFGAANVSDNSTEKINGRVQSSSELTDESGLENVRVTTRRSGNHDTREESGFYSRSDRGVRNSKYRRHKRYEDRNTPGISTSTEFEMWKTLDTARETTSNSLIEFAANPSISSAQTNNVDQISAGAKKIFTSTETLPYSSKYRKFQEEWESIPLMIDHDERYMNASTKTRSNASDSLEISLINAPKTLNASLVETSFPLDRSSAITKIDNSIIPKESPSAVGANVRVSDATTKNLFDESSTELINSQEGYEAYGNESVWTIDPLRQRNNDPSQGIFENITMENTVDSSGDVLSDQWPVKHSAVVEGDLILGGLMMVHEREDTITCGRVMPQGGVQALEAMLYTLDTLNNEGIVPGVKIGAHILDDCDKDTYGLEMAVDFIKGTYATRSMIIIHFLTYVARNIVYFI